MYIYMYIRTYMHVLVHVFGSGACIQISKYVFIHVNTHTHTATHICMDREGKRGKKNLQLPNWSAFDDDDDGVYYFQL